MEIFEAMTESVVPFQSLRCLICTKRFSDPKLLDCAHTFCLRCLRRMLRDKMIMCPICRECTTVPDDNVSNLKNNFAIMAVIDDAGNVEKKCQKCNTVITSNNTFICDECHVFLCEECSNDHDRDARHKKKDGKMTDLTWLIDTPHYCSHHKDKLSVSVCLECDRPLCQQCDESHNRQNHKVRSSAAFLFDLLADTLRLREDYKNTLDICRRNLQKGIENEKATRQLLDEMKQEVTREYDKIDEELNNEKMSLIKSCDLSIDKAKALSTNMSEELVKYSSIERNTIERLNNMMKCPFENMSEHTSWFRKHEQKAKDFHKTSMSCLESSNAIREKAENSCFVQMLKNHTQIGSIRVNSWIKNDIALSVDKMTDAAVRPDGTIAVGYFKGGIELFRQTGSDGSILKHLKVLSLAWFLDGDLVIRDINNDLSIYKNFKKSSVKFSTLGHKEGGEGVVVVNSGNMILMSYRDVRQIHIFEKKGRKAIKVVKCEGFTPQQISPGLGSDILVMDAALIKVIDDQGNIKSELQRPGHFGYPALRSDGSVLIAWVKEGEEVVEIVQYTRELKRRKKILATVLGTSTTPSRKWYKLQVVSNDKMFLCSPNTLHVFSLHVTPLEEEYSSYPYVLL